MKQNVQLETAAALTKLDQAELKQKALEMRRVTKG